MNRIDYLCCRRSCDSVCNYASNFDSELVIFGRCCKYESIIHVCALFLEQNLIEVERKRLPYRSLVCKTVKMWKIWNVVDCTNF